MPEYSNYVIAAFGIVFVTLGIYAGWALTQFLRQPNQ